MIEGLQIGKCWRKCQGAIHLQPPHGGGGVRLRWTHVDWTGWRGQAPCGRPHRKLKLESIDVILSSSHAKKLASFFYQNFVFGRNKYLRYKLVIKIIYTVLNKLQSYSRISALGRAGHFTSRFKRAMCISCRPHVDVHKGEGVWPMWTGRGGSKIRFFFD